MTREEAIQALKDLADMNVRHECDDKWITALNMAIESLQSDAVPIQEVKLKDGFKIDDIDENYEPKIVGNAKFVRSRCEVDAKSADAVQGEWTHDGSMWENRWVCNKCGHKIFERQTNFCPNCGERMTPYKGGEE